MFKKSHTQKYTFSKIQVFRIGVLHVRYLIHVFNFSKILFPIHRYFSLTAIQNISKIVCYLKTVRKMFFDLGRSTDRSTVAYYKPTRLIGAVNHSLAGVVHAVHACRSIDRSIANPSG